MDVTLLIQGIRCVEVQGEESEVRDVCVGTGEWKKEHRLCFLTSIIWRDVGE